MAAVRLRDETRSSITAMLRCCDTASDRSAAKLVRGERSHFYLKHLPTEGPGTPYPALVDR